MRIAVAIFIVGFSIAAFDGCGGDNSSSTFETTGSTSKNGVPDADGNTPFDVLRNAVTAANSGDFNGAKQWVLPNSVMGTNEVGVDVLPQKWPPFTHNGQIGKIEFVSDDYYSNEVHVHYVITFKDGSTFKERATLAKHDNRWKLTFMTENAMF